MLYIALGLITDFITTFGFIISGYLEKELDVLSSTIVYTTILVVFIGLNT
jgi:hypothetical protein